MAASKGFTKAIQQAMLDWFFNDSPSYTPPANLWVSLATAAGTGDDGTGFTECTGTNYARVSTAPTDWAAAVAGADGTASSKSNGNVVTFPTAGGSWGTAVAFGIHSASSAGTLYCVGDLGTSQAIGSGNTPSFAVGALVVQLGNPADTF